MPGKLQFLGTIEVFWYYWTSFNMPTSEHSVISRCRWIILTTLDQRGWRSRHSFFGQSNQFHVQDCTLGHWHTEKRHDSVTIKCASVLIMETYAMCCSLVLFILVICLILFKSSFFPFGSLPVLKRTTLYWINWI